MPCTKRLFLLTIVLSFSRISRWINDEEDKLKSSGETSLQYVILDMSGKYCDIWIFKEKKYLKSMLDSTTKILRVY